MLFRGFSGYPIYQSIDRSNDIIAAINSYGCNCYRISFNPTWFPSGSRPYVPLFIDYFLNNSNLYVIIDRNHHTSLDGTNDVIPWDQVESALMECCSRWGNNPRVLLEIINEYANTHGDYYSGCQTVLTRIRQAGYSNTIVQNKHAITLPWQKFVDPLDNTYQGFHFYMNQHLPQPDTSKNEMAMALNAGITKLVNTEMGADSGPTEDYSQEEVNKLNDFMVWCTNRNIGNNVWMGSGMYNLTRYNALGGLNFGFPPIQQTWLFREWQDGDRNNPRSVTV